MLSIFISNLITQLPFYGLMAACAYASWLAIGRRSYPLAVFLAAMAGAPLAMYFYSLVDARLLAPPARQAEVASWQRVTISQDNKPRTFLTTWPGYGGSIAKTLVGLRHFEKAYGLIGDDWYSFERIPGSVCAETSDNALAPDRQDKVRESTACIAATKIGGQSALMPQIAEPHLRLLTDRTAPSHRETNGNIYASSTLELRLVSAESNQLVSFWEAAYFDIPVFPPMLVIRKVAWVTEPFAAPHAPRPKPIAFVLDALGGA